MYPQKRTPPHPRKKYGVLYKGIQVYRALPGIQRESYREEYGYMRASQYANTLPQHSSQYVAREL